MTLFRYDARVNSRVYQTSDPEPDQGRGDTFTEHDLVGLYSSPRGDIVSDIDLTVVPSAYLVCVIHSEGDSFGYDENSRFVSVHLFDSEVKAAECARAIQEQNQVYRQNCQGLRTQGFCPYSVKFVGNWGEELTEATPWNGYFETLSEVRIEQVSLLGRRD